MENPNLEEFSSTYKRLVEKEAVSLVERLTAPAALKEAMKYSLNAGGKRIRPLLVFAVLHAFGQNPDKGLKPAAAIEMIHTYSLIHDDLPSMDNDDLRRGKPTSHKVFGEANAILAGDALLTLAFQVLTDLPADEVSPQAVIALIREISRAAGAEGMVGGQTEDILAEGMELDLPGLQHIHENKTGKLLSASVQAGAILAGGSEAEKEHLHTFSHHIGLAFQIQDDILDIEGTEEKIGKPVGSDLHNHKNTYPGLLTLEGAKQKLAEHAVLAKQALSATGLEISLLLELADLIALRDH
ncbi:polyprenyl synthetase family protein [Peribacillus sp. SCS-37]|uniref:polyprenyl synthetase family protein n=1 Tax=Paraperibacillus esterisolvens TaxID=3115296 RepID=UPI003905D5A1